MTVGIPIFPDAKPFPMVDLHVLLQAVLRLSQICGWLDTKDGFDSMDSIPQICYTTNRFVNANLRQQCEMLIAVNTRP